MTIIKTNHDCFHPATATSTSALSSGRSRPPARTPRAAPSCTSPRISPLYVFLSLPAFFLISSPYSHPLPERRHRRRRLRPGRREGPREERPRPGDHERRQPRVLRGEQPGAGLSALLMARVQDAGLSTLFILTYTTQAVHTLNCTAIAWSNVRTSDKCTG